MNNLKEYKTYLICCFILFVQITVFSHGTYDNTEYIEKNAVKPFVFTYDTINIGEMFDPLYTYTISDLDVADYDYDGYTDVVVMGYTAVVQPGGGNKYRFCVFKNNGDNHFSTVKDSDFGAKGVIRFLSYDSGPFLDIIVSGNTYKQYGATDEFTMVYMYNKGTDSFLDIPSNFSEYGAKFLSTGDFDNNGYNDIVLSTENETMFYSSDGSFEFTDITSEIDPLLYTVSAPSNIFDINNDGYNDILVSGHYINGNYFAKYYTIIDDSVSSGNLSEFGITGITPLYDINKDSILELITSNQYFYGDLNNDGYLDFIDTLNDQVISFVENFQTVQQPLSLPYGEILKICDINNDGNLDILAHEGNNFFIYINTNIINTKPSVPQNLKAEVNIDDLVLTWDYAADAETDSINLTYNVLLLFEGSSFLIEPYANQFNGIARKTKIGNAGYKNFLKLDNIPPGEYTWKVQTIDNSYYSSEFSATQNFEIMDINKPFGNSDLQCMMPGSDFIVADFNNDNDMDFIASDTLFAHDDSLCFQGYSVFNYYDGHGNSNDENVGDINGDNLIDFISYDTVYINNGDYTFQPYFSTYHRSPTIIQDLDNDSYNDVVFYDTIAGKRELVIVFRENNINKDTVRLSNEKFADIKVCDIDKDMDNDIITPFAIYMNKGGRKFVKSVDLEPSFQMGFVEVIDVDNDNDFDIFIFDSDNTILYINHINSFEPKIDITIPYFNTLNFTRPNWGDFNNDGYSDVLINQLDGYIYHNLGGYNFEEIQVFISATTEYGNLKWFNFDNDVDLDMLYHYSNPGGSGAWITNNILNFPNSAPDAPKNLSSYIDSFSIVLNWDYSTDAQCDNGLTYNIWVGTSSDNCDIVTPLSDIITGYRRTYAPGNAGHNNAWKLKLEEGTYYWSVQAIDQSHMGGKWAPVGTFEVVNVSPDFEFNNSICLGDDASFIDRSITTPAADLLKWKWDFGDGNVSDVQNPTYNFKEAGTYDITLWAYSTTGDSASRTYEIEVKPGPVARFSVDPVCKDEESYLINESKTDNIEIESWLWDLGNGQTSTTQGDESDIYIESTKASLTIEATNGCVSTDTQLVVVAPIPVADWDFKPGDLPIFCYGDSSVLIASDFNRDFDYFWLKGLDKVGEGKRYIVEESGVISLLVISNLKAGCIDNTLPVRFTEYDQVNKPVINVSGDTILCPDDKVILTVDTNGTNGLLDYQWLFNGEYMDNENYSISGFLDQGNYIVEASLHQECANNSDIVKIVHKTAPKKPMIYVNEGPDLYYMSCENTTAESYTWFYNGKEIPNAVKYYYFAGSQLGAYQVEITENYSECVVKSYEIMVPGGYVSMDNLENEPDFKIFPNPVTDNLNILISPDLPYNKISLKLTDICGRILDQIQLTDPVFEYNNVINMSVLPEGVYYILVNMDEKQEVIKILKR